MKTNQIATIRAKFTRLFILDVNMSVQISCGISNFNYGAMKTHLSEVVKLFVIIL